jgi:hypothetical protein
MKYRDLIQFNPIETIIQLTSANDASKEKELVRSYVMSDDMAERLNHSMLSQLKLTEVVDNKGVLLIGNYGTGKSHLMSLVSAIAHDADYLQDVQNKAFAGYAKVIAGQFEVLRVEIGSVQMSLRNIFFNVVKEDLAKRGIAFNFPEDTEIVNNKGTLISMMELFAQKYQSKGYLVVVDELLDYLGGRTDLELRRDLGFMRELGEIVKASRLRVIFGLQEKLFDNPNFSFVSESLQRVSERYEQVLLTKEDTAYVVSERILKKTPQQRAWIREHLQPYTSLFSNMSEKIEEYVGLFPIHPSYIDVFNKIYIAENRQILKNISDNIRRILDDQVPSNAPGIISYDSYWPFIKGNKTFHTDPNIKEVVEKSEILENIVQHSFPNRAQKPLALQIIAALSVHRLTTGGITVRSGLTAENLRDQLCLYMDSLPDNSSDTMQSAVQVTLRNIMTTVSGQFIEHNEENGQYFLDLDKDIDYDEKITQRAALLDDEKLNNYYYDVLYSCLQWDAKEYVTNFKIYEHTLPWVSHNIFRRGYLFLGTPDNRPTAQPPEDYYLFFLPPYGSKMSDVKGQADEVYFKFKHNEDFRNTLKLYAAALIQKELADDKNKTSYQNKADGFKRTLTRYLSDNKNTCFDVFYQGQKRQMMEIMGNRYKRDNPFKETIDLVASLSLDGYFSDKYPEYPRFVSPITRKNLAEVVRAGLDRYAGRKEQMGNSLLESFGLLEGEKITVSSSKYAQYYINQVKSLPANAVLNYSDIMEKTASEWVDKKFKLSEELVPVILLSLVYTGHAVMTLGNGKQLTASELDSVPTINVFDFFSFKHISRPKDLQLAELVRLFEVLGLSAGLINIPSQREEGVVQLLAKAKEWVEAAVKAQHKLNADFSLWGEPLLPKHLADSHQEAAKRVSAFFGDFSAKFNTVAKLNNFNHTGQEIDQLGKDMLAVQTVQEYEAFRAESAQLISYLMNIETMPLDKSLQKTVEAAKDAFRTLRDNIPREMSGEGSAQDLKPILEQAKKQYMQHYYQQHNAHRLGMKQGARKGELVSGNVLANLKRLKELTIFSAAKVDALEGELASLKVCYELEPSMLQATHFCTRCNYLPGSQELPVLNRLEDVEDKLQILLEEWTNTLSNTLSDPMLHVQMKFLSAQQRKVIEDFLKDGLPQKVDTFFVDAVERLMAGFTPITIQAEELMDQLEAMGPCDLDTFRARLDAILSDYTKDKDAQKLRIIIKR